MIDPHETFDGTWPFQARFFDGNGFRMHYIDEAREVGDTDEAGEVGDTDEAREVGDAGETFLAVHGQPTWGYLYRNIIPRLSKLGRVVVADNMGFGKSETPLDRRYTIEDHCENLERLVLELDLTNITLVLQDWGGPIGSYIAYRHPERVSRLCIMDAVVGGRSADNTVHQSPWFQWVNSEAFEPTIRNLNSTALSVMKRVGFERTAHVDETWVRAYASPFPTPESTIAAIRFPQCIADRETVEFLKRVRTPEATEAIRRKPAMYVHGEEDRAIPLGFGVGCFRDLWPDGPVTTLPGVGHFLQEDAPETVSALISQFTQLS